MLSRPESVPYCANVGRRHTWYFVGIVMSYHSLGAVLQRGAFARYKYSPRLHEEKQHRLGTFTGPTWWCVQDVDMSFDDAPELHFQQFFVWRCAAFLFHYTILLSACCCKAS